MERAVFICSVYKSAETVGTEPLLDGFPCTEGRTSADLVKGSRRVSERHLVSSRSEGRDGEEVKKSGAWM